jgi:hypothetical protein
MGIMQTLKIYWRLRPLLAQARELSKMRFSLNMVIQILGMAGQAINALVDFVPPKSKPIAAGVIGVIQAVTALLAHFSNPDGTPAADPYVKK